MTSSYLLIDYGNTCIKAGIYDLAGNKFLEWKTITKTQDPKQLLSSFTTLKDAKISKVIASITTNPESTKALIDGLKQQLNAEIKIIQKEDFQKLIDFSNINPDVIIGTDILLCSYYGMTEAKKGAVFAFGTVYFAVVYEGKSIINVQLIPSLVIGLDTIVAKTTIDRKFLPVVFDKELGLTTPDAFSSGLNLATEGFVDNVVKHFNIDRQNVILTGGDSKKFTNINSKYKQVDNIVLLAMAMLTKQKGW